MNGLLKMGSMETVFEAVFKLGLCADKWYDSKKLSKGVNNYFMSIKYEAKNSKAWGSSLWSASKI